MLLANLLRAAASGLLVLATIQITFAQTAPSITPFSGAISSNLDSRNSSLVVDGFSQGDDLQGHDSRELTKDNLPVHVGWIIFGGSMLLFFLCGIFWCFRKLISVCWRDFRNWTSDKWADFQEERLDRKDRAAARQRSADNDRQIGSVDPDITTLKRCVSTKLAGIKLKFLKRDAHARPGTPQQHRTLPAALYSPDWRNPGLLEPVGAVTRGNSIHRNESSSYTMHSLQRASLRSQNQLRHPEFLERVSLNVANALGVPAQSIREVFKADPRVQSLENQLGAFRQMTAMEFLTSHPHPPKARIASKLREEINAPTEDQSRISAVNTVVDPGEPSTENNKAGGNQKNTHKRTETQGTMQGITKVDSIGKPLQRSESQGTMARIEAVAAMGPKDDIANELQKLTETPSEDEPDLPQVNDWGRQSEDVLRDWQAEELEKRDSRYKKRRFSKRYSATVEDDKEESA